MKYFVLYFSQDCKVKCKITNNLKFAVAVSACLFLCRVVWPYPKELSFVFDFIGTSYKSPGIKLSGESDLLSNIAGGEGHFSDQD